MKTPVEPTPLVSDEHRITPMSALIDPQECEGMSKSRIWAVYESERATRETALTKLIAERDELVGAYRRLLVRFEEATGERPHTYCGCTYCESTAILSKYK